jgi:hypothetical protein
LQFDLTFFLVHLSTLCSFIMLFLTLKVKKKAQIQIVFFASIIVQIIWNVSTLMDLYTRQLLNYTGMFFININYLSICFIPVCVFLLGLTYAKTKVDYSSNYLLLLIIPVITTILIWTNEYHHLFFVNYSNYSSEAVYGSYYYFHSAYSYGLIFAGAYFLFSSALKKFRLFFVAVDNASSGYPFSVDIQYIIFF